VTFDDLPECPRCKESFALVRPLASSSLDGARHVLRDDPELRLKLRDRLHRARLDRRRRNDNPLVSGPDPDAPDWFEPQLGGGNGDAEASMTPTPEAGERSEEGEIVPIDDLSPEDDVRGGAATADADGEVDIIEASRETEDDQPEFSGDVPGFTDWREELRERLKRIRARREQERLAEQEAAAAEQEAAEVEAAEAGEIEAADEQVDQEQASDAELIEAADEPEEDQQAAELEAAEATDEPEEDEEAAELETAEAVDEPEEDEEAAELEVIEAADEPEEDQEAAELEAAEATDEPEEDEEAAELEVIEAADEPEEDQEAAELEAAEAADEPEEDEEAAELEVVEDREEDVEAAAEEDERAAQGGLPTAGDVIAKIIDGGGDHDIDIDLEQAAASGDIDFTLVGDEAADLDLAPDPGEQQGEAGPEALILGEKEAEPSVLPEQDEEESAEDHTEAGDRQVEEIAMVATDDDETAADAGDQSAQDFDEIFAAETDDDEAPADDDDEEPVLAGGEEIGLEDAVPELDHEDEVVADALEQDRRSDDELDLDADDAEIDIGIEETDEDIAAEDAEPELDDWEIISDAEEADADLDVEDTEAELALEEDEADEFAPEPETEEAGLPAARMPAVDGDGAPELDFDTAQAAQAPEIDLPESEATEHETALEWDSEQADVEPAARSSAGPLGERAAAALCDALVLTAIGAALVGAASSGAGVPFRQILVEEAVWLGLAWSIFAAGYSVFFVGSCGQTIGRMVMRLRVIGDDQFSVGFDRAAIRLAAWLVSALPALAGMLPALRDPQRRALHDRLSHTRVVKA
jgi:uncharacterized RDD family membrane protein YckC